MVTRKWKMVENQVLGQKMGKSWSVFQSCGGSNEKTGCSQIE
jgi:hypothetical protein